MKTLLFVLFLIPSLVFGQVSTWRQSGGSVSSQTTPRVQPSVPQQQNNVSRWRTQTEPIRPGQPIPNQPLVRRWRGTNINPYGLMWGTWGWYQPFPYIWYDDFGWRQRSVIHIYENGRRDTIRKEKVYTSFGFGHTNNKQISYWGMAGGKK